MSTRHSRVSRAKSVSAFEVSLPSRKDTRFLVPRAAVRARPLQHLEVAAPRRVCARLPVPRKIRRSKCPQRLKLSAPRCCGTNECPLIFTQKAPRVPVLQQAHVSELHRFNIRQLLYRTPRRVHGVAHPVTHRAKPTEIPGLRQKVRSENVRGDHVGGKAREVASRHRGGIHESIVALRRNTAHRGRGSARGVGIVRRARMFVRRSVFIGRYDEDRFGRD